MNIALPLNHCTIADTLKVVIRIAHTNPREILRVFMSSIDETSQASRVMVFKGERHLLFAFAVRLSPGRTNY
ncbi:Uncharacterised protein [Actinomyces howellii]|uniref:Uncharacterized protein n=1 Tax=Actinomyces howellii TaxID=52771 RepID=A0A3S4T899_9ACTO|nr:Uncharacterised protein [Actinomyces howellii]